MKGLGAYPPRPRRRTSRPFAGPRRFPPPWPSGRPGVRSGWPTQRKPVRKTIAMAAEGIRYASEASHKPRTSVCGSTHATNEGSRWGPSSCNKKRRGQKQDDEAATATSLDHPSLVHFEYVMPRVCPTNTGNARRKVQQKSNFQRSTRLLYCSARGICVWGWTHATSLKTQR